jgi:cell wall-associated NlpC family hydrolase
MSRRFGCIFVIGVTVAAGACATTGATPKPFPTPKAPNNPSPTTESRKPKGESPKAKTLTGPALAYSVTGTALGLRGAPYRNGGTDPSGFDCSGFVQYVFGQNGVGMPRTVGDLFRAGRAVDAQQGLQPGDLVFFTTVAPGASHVGIAIGGDEFVHAPSSTGEVRVERLSASYWSTRFVGARRVI